MEEFLKALLAGQQAQAQASAALLEEQRKANQLKAEELQLQKKMAAHSVGPIKASNFISKMGSTDNVEAYLHAFEATATREGWPKVQWVGLLAPFLTGESLNAVRDLPPDKLTDYDALKTEILSRHGLTKYGMAQRFQSWTFHADQAPRTQMHELSRIARKWLEPDKNTAADVVETIVVDHYLRALPYEAKRFVSQQALTTVDLTIEAVEKYQATTEMLRTSKRDPRTTTPQLTGGGHSKNPKVTSPTTAAPSYAPLRAKSQPGPVRMARDNDTRQCYRCGEIGHMSWQCDKQLDEPMPTAGSSSSPSTQLFASLIGVTDGPPDRPPTCPVTVNCQDVEALLDSGSRVTLVHKDLVDPSCLSTDKVLPISCVHGDTKDYPTTELKLTTTRGTLNTRAGVVDSLPVPVLIGRDCPAFHQLFRETQQVPARAPRSRRGMAGTQADTESGPDTEEENMAGGISPSSNEGDAQVIEDLPHLTGQYGAAQLQDPTLVNALKNVQVLEGRIVGERASPTYPHFAVIRGLLYQVVKEKNEILEQLLVPQPHRATVLNLAHTHLLGAHLGVEKTTERILQRFFWPGVHKEIENFCRSCPDCQKRAPKPTYRNPLIPLPIIETPFQRIGLDIVGPLPKSSRGHQYILVILDYATRYPEAIPLRKATSRQIAKELFLLSTSLGIPKEILTDQGSPFMSRVMKELCALLKIKQLRTSVYHPQTDGLVERFNKTLKSMLKKSIEEDGRNWDQLLPYLLFAIREVPQSSTGFSPFELLLSYRPRGLLDIAKEAWEEQPCKQRTIVEHVGAMKERMRVVYPIVREHMETAQRQQQASYNRPAQPREFKPGDRVLVLVPTVECKFLATWQGPYEVIERIGEVNYKVRQPDKRKTEQIYHINLLKKWHAREALFCCLPPTESKAPAREEVLVGPGLSPHQRQETLELVDRNRDVFSSLPGNTEVVQHEILTVPGRTVTQRPYRVPEARKVAIEQEVKSMLELGVIEESKSPWASPIVLVPKPDGSVRFCNDYRKLNEVSQFDSYPMPRVDDLVDSLGHARFLTTLDLTKGYWQVPLTPASKEKTAFATPEGLYQYTRLPFGLHGAPATFQRLMDRVLGPHKRYAAAFLDDVVIQSPDWESHLPRVQAVLDSLRNAGLTANPKKCRLAYSETNYLGYTVGRGLVKPQEAKLQAIRDWPRPLTKKQVRSFLGLAGYYRRFIANFASIAAPLTDLTTKRHSRMVKWDAAAETAFILLKQALCSSPVLVAPDFGKEFVVQTDASEVGLGAVLAQVQEGEEHPVLYLSRKLLPREKNYSTVEKECLAVTWALESLRYYLLGRRFTVVSDHAPLQWMARNKETNSRITRWFLSLQAFNFSVVHRAGRSHGNADALSRRDALFVTSSPTRTSSPRGRICGITRGCVLEGRYIPRKWLHTQTALAPSGGGVGNFTPQHTMLQHS
ncbi:uncharacterized protein LOC134461440 [Engraulis encrasicolus]|uniref:uncharacterized protein LOC134461440 n=1 Tax=Engraulis encrasicolus TaxID=184585 RepID=UPI002FD65096